MKTRGRPVYSVVRQNIIELLFFMGKGYGYDIFRAYKELFPKVTLRSIYYHLKKGIELGEFEIERIEKEKGDYSWGEMAEKIYYKLGSKAAPTMDKRIKKYLESKKELKKMVNKELIDYIKSVKEKGYTDKAIKSSLLQYNYTQEAIDEAFKELLLPTQPEIQASEPQKVDIRDKKKKKGFPAVLLVLFLILLLGGAAFVLWNFVIVGSLACKDTSIDIYHIKSEPVVCIFPDNSKVQLIIFNNGNTELSKVEITVLGTKGEMHDIVENINLKSQDVFTRTFNYNYSKTGDIKSIRLLPYVSGNSRTEACISKKATYDKIKFC